MSEVLTTDPNDPDLGHGSNDHEVPQNKKYLVLSNDEIVKGYTRPLRDSYKHTRCGQITSMGFNIAQTYARDPKFYGSTYCTSCRRHLPVSEFTWLPDGSVVGS